MIDLDAPPAIATPNLTADVYRAGHAVRSVRVLAFDTAGHPLVLDPPSGQLRRMTPLGPGEAVELVWESDYERRMRLSRPLSTSSLG